MIWLVFKKKKKKSLKHNKSTNYKLIMFPASSLLLFILLEATRMEIKFPSITGHPSLPGQSPRAHTNTNVRTVLSRIPGCRGRRWRDKIRFTYRHIQESNLKSSNTSSLLFPPCLFHKREPDQMWSKLFDFPRSYSQRGPFRSELLFLQENLVRGRQLRWKTPGPIGKG